MFHRPSGFPLLTSLVHTHPAPRPSECDCLLERCGRYRVTGPLDVRWRRVRVSLAAYRNPALCQLPGRPIVKHFHATCLCLRCWWAWVFQPLYSPATGPGSKDLARVKPGRAICLFDAVLITGPSHKFVIQRPSACRK